jgi:N6-adenosine-specific RNA methylase IME4
MLVVMRDDFTSHIFAWLHQVFADKTLHPTAFKLAFAVSQHINRKSRKAWPSLPTLASAVGITTRAVIEAPRRKHSAKPEKVYDLIEQMYPGLSYIELFCRSPREGWDAWGNQAQEGNRAEAAEEASR